MNRALFLIASICAVLALALSGCGATSKAESISEKPEVDVPSGPPPKQLEKNDLIEGQGAEAKAGDDVAINYVSVGYDTGEEFETSWGRNPYRFTLDSNEVLQGWDKGIVGMKVGGRRELIVPPRLAYGKGGIHGEPGGPPVVGPYETVIFVIDLVSVN